MKIKKNVPTEESWTQEIELPAAPARSFKQVNTLMLSEKSRQSTKAPKIIHSPPSVGQLHRADSTKKSKFAGKTPFSNENENERGPEVLVQDTTDH